MTQPTLTFHDGHTMPQFGLGLWQVDRDKAADITRDAIEQGYRLIDGAWIYGNEDGQGAGVSASSVDRADIFVTSKVWSNGMSHDDVRNAVQASLDKMKLDYLDLMLLHWPFQDADVMVTAWKALIDARKDGQVRSVGVSNFHAHHLDRIIGDTGVVPVLNQIEVSPRLQQAEMRRVNASHGIITQSWTPLGQGRSFDAEPITAAAARAGKTPAQVILRWHIQMGCSVIPRSTKSERLAENFDIFDFELTEQEMDAIATLDQGERTGPDPDQFDMKA
ncbi:MAG: aldo/keto reductase [Pseudomonadota bacterium]